MRRLLKGLVLDGKPKPRQWWRMNILALFMWQFVFLAQQHTIGLMPKIIFWILLILWGIGSFGWHDNPRVVRGTNLVLVILFGVLGYYTFGF